MKILYNLFQYYSEHKLYSSALSLSSYSSTDVESISIQNIMLMINFYEMEKYHNKEFLQFDKHSN